MRLLHRSPIGLMVTVLALSSLLVGAVPAQAAAGYTLTGVAAGSGTTTTDAKIKLTATLKKNGHAAKSAKALLQYQNGAGTWVTEKKVTIRSGKGSVKVKHGVGDRTYRFTVKGKATSAPFVVHFVPATFTVAGSGRGHGVGMSQYGAYQLARTGMTAEQILKHYYVGAGVSDATNNARTVKVQVLGPPSDSRTTTTLSISAGGFTVRGGGSAPVATASKKSISVGVSGSSVRAKVTLASGKAATLSGARLTFSWGSSATVLVAGAQGSYRYGNLQATVIGKRPNLVNELRMNTEYLYGIDEMPSSWGTAAGKGVEALKAQAVAARTYVITQATKWKTDADPLGVNPACDCQIFDDSRSQNFTGWKKAGGAGNAAWRQAVDATMDADKVTVLRTSTASGSGIAEALYFASSGSYTAGGISYSGTASNADAWASPAVGYLTHVDDPDSALAPGNPYVSWTRKVGQAQVAKIFGIGAVRSLAVTDRSAGGLMKSLTATSATGVTKTMALPTEAWRTGLGLPGAWVAGIAGR